RADLARNELMRGNQSGAVPMLESSAQEAESRGATYLRTRCGICLASARLATGRAADAESVLRRVLRDAENMGAAALVAQSHHLLAEALRDQGNEADAERHADKAAQILDEIRQEAGSDGPLRRADLRPVAESSSPTSQ
ncbi:MAG: tetratricopeptide repeat protein, partial [Acidobacteria bacterium]|nr:tetratricopeptide repeat protein [Acidobacteriota bacterium]